MKIAIITYHRATNYGAVLQAYALQKKIMNIMSDNDSCKVIDYHCKSIESMRKIIHFDRRLVKDIVRLPFTIWDDVKCIHRFDDFLNRYFILEKLNRNNLEEINSKFDVFISGSDQVWNCDVCRDDDAYFLTFVEDNHKKRSYAASIGTKELFMRDRTRIIERIKSFPVISLREPTCLGEIKNVVTDIRIDIDPTLLLSREEWERISNNVNAYGAYILIYCVAPPEGLLNIAEKLQKKTGYRVIYLTNQLSKKIKYRSFSFEAGIGPVEFVNLVKHARYVLTTSFHGTVFSLLFHKTFYAEVNNQNGHNYRISNLLKAVQAECFGEADIVFNDSVNQKVDWNAIDDNIKRISDSSIHYLWGIITGDK